MLPSCMQPTEAVIQTTVVTKTVSATAETTTVVKVIDPITGNEYDIKPGEVGVGNADMRVNRYRIGVQTPAGMVLILNGRNDTATVRIGVAPYDNDTIVSSPSDVADWVTITSPNLQNNVLTIPAMSAAALNVSLNVPAGSSVPNTWAFLVSATEYPRVVATGGFTGFSYDIGDSKTSFTWTLIPTPTQNTSGSGETVNTSGFPSKIMIRAKEGNYPSSPADANTNPSDGRLIFFGDGYAVTTAVDTQATSYTYYRAWVQREDGSWYTNGGVSSLTAGTSRWIVNMSNEQ